MFCFSGLAPFKLFACALSLRADSKRCRWFQKVKGIRRQQLVDSNGYPLLIDITTGNIHDSKGVSNLLKDMYIYYPSIKVIRPLEGGGG